MIAGIDPFQATDVASGILWSATYLLILRRGFLDRTSGVPLLALAAAITWELIFAVVRPTPTLPPFVVPVWLAIDSCLLYQHLRHDSPVRAVSLAALAAAFALQYAVVVDLGDVDGVWSGFAVNVVMSLAFLAMLERRRSARGQSMYIAIGKMVGSAITIPHAYALHGSLWSLRAFMGVTLVGDVAYAVLLARQCRGERIRPWARL